MAAAAPISDIPVGGACRLTVGAHSGREFEQLAHSVVGRVRIVLIMVLPARVNWTLNF